MSDGLDEYRNKEYIKKLIRRDEREEIQNHKNTEYENKKRDRRREAFRREEFDKERQELRASISRGEFDYKNKIRQVEKAEDQHLKNQGAMYQSDIQRANHADTLQHTANLSEQEHKQKLKEEARWRNHEITVLNGKLQAERAFIQERYKGELELQQGREKSELARAEILAEWDYNERIDTEKEITGREISLAKEQTSRELALARENNQHEIVLEKEKHLIFLEQKSQELEHYQARVLADSEALTLKEDQALERRLTESRHTFGQDIQKLHAEFLRMKLENKLKKDYFTHEQETLLRIRKLARDLGLDYSELSPAELSTLIMEFENDLDKGV